MTKNNEKQLERNRRTRSRVLNSGSKERPRLSVFRSAKHICAQLINDDKQETLLSVSDSNLETDKLSHKPIVKAFEVGKILALKAKDKKIVKVIFDRGRYLYHGRIKALADGARAGGLKF